MKQLLCTGWICERHPKLPFEHNDWCIGPGEAVYDNRHLFITRGFLWWRRTYCAAFHSGGIRCNFPSFYL